MCNWVFITCQLLISCWRTAGQVMCYYSCWYSRQNTTMQLRHVSNLCTVLNINIWLPFIIIILNLESCLVINAKSVSYCLKQINHTVVEWLCYGIILNHAKCYNKFHLQQQIYIQQTNWEWKLCKNCGRQLWKLELTRTPDPELPTRLDPQPNWPTIYLRHFRWTWRNLLIHTYWWIYSHYRISIGIRKICAN